MKYILLFCMTIAAAFFSFNASAKREVVRQLGGACGEDSNIIATCASGLQCKNGNCEMQSFLSSATVGCKEAMQQKGVGPKEYVAVHGGFCYIDRDCRGLYDQVMAANDVTWRLLRSGTAPDATALARLPADDRARFERAANTCQQCGKCVIGAQFF